MSKKLTQKALLQKAKARLTGDDPIAAEMFLLAHKLGVKSARVTFSGSGDDGDFHGCDMEGGEPAYVYDDKGSCSRNPKHGEEYDTLGQKLTELAQEWVDGTGEDWYNNDGGTGHVEFDFKTGAVSGYIAQYEQVEHEVAGEEWNLLEDKEEGAE
jgi:hypothetical protein